MPTFGTDTVLLQIFSGYGFVTGATIELTMPALFSEPIAHDL
ncbi:hypothetical protein [Chamaesiphon sp. OTE_8_metabat_110]|nr:hypothetical protein [Chamaesiphon sp. OTE_8_metabat_110]